MWVIQALISVFFAILFIQSGLDKVFDWKGNLEWLTGHFANSFLSKTVPLLLVTLTVVEAAGVISAVGAFEALLFKTYCFAFLGIFFVLLHLSCSSSDNVWQRITLALGVWCLTSF